MVLLALPSPLIRQKLALRMYLPLLTSRARKASTTDPDAAASRASRGTSATMISSWTDAVPDQAILR